MSATDKVLNFIKENYPRDKWVNLSSLQKASGIDYSLLSKSIEMLETANCIEVDNAFLDPKIRLR